MQRDPDRVLEEIQAVMHELRRYLERNEPIRISKTLMVALTTDLQEVREELKRLKQRSLRGGANPPRSIYICEANEDVDMAALADADVALRMNEAGYKGGRNDNLLVTDAQIFKALNWLYGDGDVITIYESWPT